MTPSVRYFGMLGNILKRIKTIFFVAPLVVLLTFYPWATAILVCTATSVNWSEFLEISGGVGLKASINFSWTRYIEAVTVGALCMLLTIFYSLSTTMGFCLAYSLCSSLLSAIVYRIPLSSEIRRRTVGVASFCFPLQTVTSLAFKDVPFFAHSSRMASLWSLPLYCQLGLPTFQDWW